MGLFSRIAAPRQRASALPSYSGLMGPLGSVQTASGMLVSQSTAMSVSTVYACVRLRALDAARCPGSLYTVNDDGTRTDVDDHPLVALFTRPNRAQNWLEFAEQMNVALLLRGNAYAVALRDGRGRVTELIPINPDAVQVLEAADGSIFYMVNRIGLWQLAVLRGLEVAIPEEDVLHVRGLTFNSLVGASTIGLGRDAIGLAMGQEQQAARWMANGARPSGILETPVKLSPDAGKRLVENWNNFKAGIQNTGNTAVLEEGMQWKNMALSSVDLEFLNSRSFQIPEICRYFGVPPHKIFVIDRAASMSIPQQDQQYVNATIAPDLERWEQKFERFFDLDKGDIQVHFDEGQLLRADVMTRFNSLRIGILTGIITPNEARETEGLPPLPGGDNLLIPANTAALGSEVTGTAPDDAGRPPAGQVPAPPVGTGGTQPNAGSDDDDPQPLPGAEELFPGQGHAPAMMRLADVQPLSLTVNVDARNAGVTKRTGKLRRNEDGSVEIDVVEAPANENEPLAEDGEAA